MANTIGNYIKALRIQADMTQESLAAILHVSRQTMSVFLCPVLFRRTIVDTAK